MLFRSLHPRILYETRTKITTPLKLIFEASLELKELSHDWVIANISAVYKKRQKVRTMQLQANLSYEYSVQNNGTIYKGLYNSAFFSTNFLARISLVS